MSICEVNGSQLCGVVFIKEILVRSRVWEKKADVSPH